MGDNGSVRIGVYVCHCGTNITSTVDVEKVAKAAAREPGVVVSRDYKFMCSDPGQDLIKQDIRNYELDRVVIAACSPRMHEPTFQKLCNDGGLNPYLMQMANIREHCSWVTRDPAAATEKTLSTVRAAIRRSRWMRPLTSLTAPVEPSTLVIGGGIAGIQASLSLADAGCKVYLVEKEQSIGGHMAKLDKTFPTLDCSACILTPKMVEVSQHPNIEVLTYHEVDEVKGSVGDFSVKLRRKATYVDHDKCTGCGMCMTKCPVKKIPSEFEEKLANRSAIYTLFPQAVPNKPVIDKENCNFFTRGKCGVCEKFCELGAINFADQDRIFEIKVGTIILTTGYDMLDLADLAPYGYGKYPDVYTGLEFERLCSAAGPTGGKILKKNGKEPAAVAILHCIGSRDENHCKHCSRVCCMYALKFAHLLTEKTTARVFNFFIDMRCFGKGYEEFYHRVLREGVRFIRGKAGRITDVIDPDLDEPEGSMVVLVEDATLGRLRRVPVDMVVLAGAITPTRDARQIAQMLRISRSPDGFFLERHPKLAPMETASDGIFLAGACQGPKDIPDTVAQASGAAAAAMRYLARGEVKLEPAISVVRPEFCTGCLMCRDVCAYQAIDLDEQRGIARVNATLCKGCGTCGATCRANAIEAQHFTDRQLFHELNGLLADQTSDQTSGLTHEQVPGFA